MPVIGMGGGFLFGPGVASLSQVADDVRTVIAPGAAHFVPKNPQFLIDCVGYFLGDIAGPPPPALADCAA